VPPGKEALTRCGAFTFRAFAPETLITSNAKDTRWKTIAGASRCARCEQLGGFYRAKGEFNCDVAVLSYLTAKERTMKFTTIALATAFALTSTVALAQAPGLGGYGSVVAPSVGSYVAPSVGSTNVVPTWRNTGPAAPLPSATVSRPFRNSFARIRGPRRSLRIRTVGTHR
jgi:hypothetical protein